MKKVKLNVKDKEIFLAKLYKTGILKYEFENIFDELKAMQELIEIKESDSKIERVFKYYIIFGNIPEVRKATGIKDDEISDILFFKKCKDINLTFYAKLIYAISGTKFYAFMKWQVEAMEKNGDIDVRDEYIKWRKASYEKDEKIYGPVSMDEIIEEADRISFENEE